MYQCPVCGYARLTSPPRDYHICPCCGTEFGADDIDFSHEEIRSRWIATGAHWFSTATPQPDGWDAGKQLVVSGVAVTSSSKDSTSGSDVSAAEVAGVSLGTSWHIGTRGDTADYYSEAKAA